MKEVSELSDWDQGTVRGLVHLTEKRELTQGECRQTVSWIRNDRPQEENDDE